MPEFQPGQRVKVREKGGAPSSLPDTRFLGQEGTIRDSIDGPPTIYFVEFDNGEE